jgi:hypothetical protein
MAARRTFRWSMGGASEVRKRSVVFDAAPRRDANASAEGEEYPPTSGGAAEQAFDQGRRRVRLSGRDQETGENFGAELWLPGGGQGNGVGKPGDRRTGDAAMCDLVTPKDGCAEISGLATWQRMLDRHYAGK